MEFVSGNIFIRPNRLERKGDIVDGHTHNFDHTTIVFTGAVRVEKSAQRVDENGNPMTDENGNPVFVRVMDKTFSAPSHFLVEANSNHKITAVEDNTIFWCVYSHRSPQGEVVQEWNGWYEAAV